jgi:HlyD family secretion protein
MAKQELFRKTALARLASPEQLDQLMEVTDSRGWWTLAALGGLVVAALLWAIVGRIPTTVQGTGILLREGGVFDVQTIAGGQVTGLQVVEGQNVKAGDIIARVAQPELLRQIDEAQQVIRDLEGRQRQTATYSTAELRSRLSTLEQRRIALESDTASTRSQTKWLTTRLAQQQEAQKIGLVTGEQVEAVRQQLDAARGRYDNDLTALRQLEVDIISARQSSLTNVRTVDDQLADERRRLQILQGRLEQAERVVSTQSGRVLEVKTDVGSIVAPSTAVVSIELASRPLRAMLVVPTTGRITKPGMAVRVVPSAMSWQDAGFILGKVETISETPVTLQRLQRLLHNEQLSQALMSKGATYLVEVSLERDNTLSGFKWTTKKGSDQPVTTGMLASGRITVDEQRPISLVIPILRTSFGL